MWLLIDAANLAYRHHHGRKNDPDAAVTGPILGALEAAAGLPAPHSFVFCFDHDGPPLRRQLYPAYKERAASEDRRVVRRGLEILRTEVLPRAGFRNVLAAEGYEADDVIAACVGHLAAAAGGRPGDKCCIVSSDRDLYQLLRPGVLVRRPDGGRLVTAGTFRDEYGVSPADWPMVKAIAGCEGDGVPGVPGVGVATAAKYLRGELPEHHAAYKNIVAAERGGLVARNHALVKLPYQPPGKNAGPPEVRGLIYDELNHAQWNGCMVRHGLTRLLGKCPSDRKG